MASAFVGMSACSGSKSHDADTAKTVDTVTAVDTMTGAPETAVEVETATAAAEPTEATVAITKGMKLKDVAAIPGVKFYADGSANENSGMFTAWIYVKYEGKKYDTSIFFGSNQADFPGLTESGQDKYWNASGDDLFPNGVIKFKPGDFTSSAVIK